jgi:hypothetical protein
VTGGVLIDAYLHWRESARAVTDAYAPGSLRVRTRLRLAAVFGVLAQIEAIGLELLELRQIRPRPQRPE